MILQVVTEASIAGPSVGWVYVYIMFHKMFCCGLGKFQLTEEFEENTLKRDCSSTPNATTYSKRILHLFLLNT
jgi:hypothetical protein